MTHTGRGLAFLFLAVVCSVPSRADTPPLDWKLVVDVTPMNLFTHPTSEDRIRVLLRGEQTPACLGLTFAPPVVSGTTIRFQGHRVGPAFECTPGTWIEEHRLKPLPAAAGGVPAVYTLEVWDEDLLIRSQPLEVREPLKRLSFGFASGSHGAALTVGVRLTDPRAGAPRDASAFPLTESSGYFWFFDPENAEVTVKIVDGRSINGHLWVFVAGMSNLAYTVSVVEEACFPDVCASKTYTNRAGRQLNVIDTTTF